MTYRLRNIAVAIGLALVAALLTTFYVANYKRHVRQTESTVKVFVAKRDIPQGTPGTELIKHGAIGTTDVVQRTVVPGAISSIDQVQTLLTTQPIYAGEQVTLRRFAIAPAAGDPLPAARPVARRRASGHVRPAARGDAQGRRPRGRDREPEDRRLQHVLRGA